jgi:hypothetical protein
MGDPISLAFVKLFETDAISRNICICLINQIAYKKKYPINNSHPIKKIKK